MTLVWIILDIVRKPNPIIVNYFTLSHRIVWYVIVVFQRSDYLYRELLELTRTLPNVALTPWRMATIWGGSSLLQMLLKSIEDLLRKQEWKWDFFINLSESDYPIKWVIFGFDQKIFCDALGNNFFGTTRGDKFELGWGLVLNTTFILRFVRVPGAVFFHVC